LKEIIPDKDIRLVVSIDINISSQSEGYNVSRCNHC
jgi:hypothetical protein